jgi:hypothetical protein
MVVAARSALNGTNLQPGSRSCGVYDLVVYMTALPRVASVLWICLALLTASTTPVRAGTSADSPPFRYYNFIWVNLHHYLYNEAFPTGHGIGQTIPGLSAVQKTAVANAIDFYRSHYQDRDLLFDRELHTITQQVIAAGNTGLPSTGIPDDLRKTLQSVYPIYMKYLWASQKLENHHWIVSNQQLLSRYGPAIQHELERVLQRKFSDGPYQVYVVHEANWPGGYTSEAERGTHPHTVISSGRPDYRGLAGLEMVFHESLHAGPFDTVQAALDAEFARHNAKDEVQLWHAVLFYTAGEIVREVLSADGVAFQPYEYAPGGPFTRGRWARVEATVRKYWLPYMQGKIDMRKAVAQMVTEITVQ